LPRARSASVLLTKRERSNSCTIAQYSAWAESSSNNTSVSLTSTDCRPQPMYCAITSARRPGASPAGELTTSCADASPAWPTSAVAHAATTAAAAPRIEPHRAVPQQAPAAAALAAEAERQHLPWST
jgi:hypothetical protein